MCLLGYLHRNYQNTRYLMAITFLLSLSSLVSSSKSASLVPVEESVITLLSPFALVVMMEVGILKAVLTLFRMSISLFFTSSFCVDSPVSV